MKDTDTLVFRPHPPDQRRAWLRAGLYLLPFIVITVLLWLITEWWVALPWTVAAVLAATLALLILFRSPYVVSYRLEADALVLRYGRLVNYRLPYRTIKDVRRYTLERTSDWRPPRNSSWAMLPGLDITGYRTEGVGYIRTLATTSSGPIVLIEAEHGNFGINPHDEEGFITALRQRVRWGGAVWE